MMEPQKTPETDPNAILKALELELQVRKQKRLHQKTNRTAYRAGGIVAILLLLLAALWIMQTMLSQMPRPVRPAQVEPAAP